MGTALKVVCWYISKKIHFLKFVTLHYKYINRRDAWLKARLLKLSGQTLDGNFLSCFLSINVHSIKLSCTAWNRSLKWVIYSFGSDVLTCLWSPETLVIREGQPFTVSLRRGGDCQSHWKIKVLLDVEEISGGVEFRGLRNREFPGNWNHVCTWQCFSITDWKCFFYSESDNPQLLLNKMVSYLFSRKVLSAFYRSGEEKGDQLLSSLFMHLFFPWS